jgi:predicted RNase H-like HicB family nuclease
MTLGTEHSVCSQSPTISGTLREYESGVIMTRQVTAIIEKEGDGYVGLCPELDIASQGDSVGEARANLKEALELFFESASAVEIQDRFHKEVYVTQVEVAVG